MADYSSLPKSDRTAYVYECATEPGVWRIRVHLFNAKADGWYGGRVLWGHDKSSLKEANKVANQWINKGILPQ